ncbi:hypothetical protein H6804_00270 [Candidatus Nomurabacteria bacterium]|mgnify:CR=1 FL=1|nr:hypothetical protein [Candidatus Woesebacteria bacterium]MCB9826698.1 hypothetical protein [Candidatus Nomurabacteria bacterium]
MKKINVVIVIALVLFGIGLILFKQKQTQTRQEYIHDRGVMVMPFDLDKTTHVFTKTDQGGIQQIQAKDSQDTEQINLIRTHLQKEKELFDNGDFSDPSTLHGESMPGLDVLEKSADKLKVEYSDLPNGAQLTYLTDDDEVIDAVHLWFMAQLQDHGMDAMEH